MCDGNIILYLRPLFQECDWGVTQEVGVRMCFRNLCYARTGCWMVTDSCK